MKRYFISALAAVAFVGSASTTLALDVPQECPAETYNFAFIASNNPQFEATHIIEEVIDVKFVDEFVNGVYDNVKEHFEGMNAFVLMRGKPETIAYGHFNIVLLKDGCAKVFIGVEEDVFNGIMHYMDSST